MQNSKPLHTDALTLLAKATSRGLSSETCLGYGWAPRAASTRQPAISRGLQSTWLVEVKSPLRILLHAPRTAEFGSKCSLSA